MIDDASDQIKAEDQPAQKTITAEGGRESEHQAREHDCGVSEIGVAIVMRLKSKCI